MNTKKGFICPAVILTAFLAQASGFGLYEASSKTYAMGGAVLGKAADASANFHNPATLTDLTNITVTIGAMTEHPRARMKVTQNGHTYASEKMDPGCFVLPHFHLAIPLPWDFTFGLGMMPEYGLGSKYSDSWRLNASSTETTIESFTINPNLAYKITDKLSIGAGLRFLYWDFEQYSKPNSSVPGYDLTNRLKGDNSMSDLGYQVGVKYDLFDNFSLGLTYKSWTDCHVDGKRVMRGSVPGVAHYYQYYDASANLEMPQSVTGGFNWDITDDWHLGGLVAWTQWSSIDTIHFDFMANGVRTVSPCYFNWDDTWRFGLAPSWDFAEDWTWIASYVFETDCADGQYSTMLPPSDRHMLSTGFVWNCWRGLELALTYGMILMDGNDSHVDRSNPGVTYCAHRGISHAAGFSITYRF